MIKILKISCVIVLVSILNSCASGYQKINPKGINYVSKNIENNILLEYKYDLLQKKYKKKETKNEVKLIAVKITKYCPCLKKPNVILNCQTAFCMPYIKKLIANKITTESGNMNLIPIHNAIKSLIKKMAATEAIP